MKPTAKTLLGAAIVLTVAVSALAEDRVVRVYNWSDYIADDTIEKFEAQTGIRVTYDVFDSNEVLEAKVLSGQSGYDVVVPTSDYLARHIMAGAYQKLDKSQIPNWKNLDKNLLETLSTYDPGNEYGVPYQWGTTGIGYNINKVEEILGEDAPTNSWDLLLDPKYASQLGQCGIALLDSAGEVLPLVLHYLGLDPNSTNTKDYEAAAAKMAEIRPYITYFHSSRYISDLANGDICLTVGYSGDVFQAMARAEEAENGVEIGYYIPSEGTALWSDMLAIPKDSKNVAEAHEFINFILDAQIGADITNYVWYGSPNMASREFIDAEILEDPGVYPPDGTELFSFKVLPNKVKRVMTRTWTSIKTGK
jgi:putrescine transport system substrate-binding protein